ncbi:SDR family NAD(P)-dependent oxidoreductase [Paenibacillus sp. VMFN-D1]|uniref:SDR family NAD(P)-dependent oxidoreductase n=1 Tax=Paenibacillus sp. VMFN-D1 TaxID=2135608 RepID=UPI000E27B79D
MGVFLGMKYHILEMQKTFGGSIVNFASIAGLNGMPYAGPYSANKTCCCWTYKIRCFRLCHSKTSASML